MVVQPSKKKSPAEDERPGRDPGDYRAAIAEYESAVTRMRSGDLGAAREAFLALAAKHPEEPELADRARIWGQICAQRMAPTPPEPRSAEECFHRGVFLANQGRADEAIRLFDRSLAADPSSVKTLYARACAWAMKGEAERAVFDLRSAITADPTVRFQAANDSDFERIREEPSFIDVIEPSGA
jgi:tetratricopeptide (TPR) repeat protein